MAGELRDKLEHLDPRCLSGDDAKQLVEVFDELGRLCCAGRLLSAHRAAQCNVWRAEGRHESPGQWLAEQSGIPVCDAERQLATAGRLVELPEVADAFRRGQLSPQQADEVAKAAAHNPAAQSDLLDTARRKRFKDLKARARQIRQQAASAEDDAARAARLHRRRRAYFGTDDEGMGTLNAALPPQLMARLRQAVLGEADQIFDHARQTGLRESPAAYRADALLALAERGRLTAHPNHTTRHATHQPDTHTTQDTTTSTGTTNTTNTTTGDGTTSTGTTSGGTTSGGPDGHRPASVRRQLTPRMLIRVDLTALQRGYTIDGEICDIPGVGPIPVATARQLLGESLLTLVITHGVDVRTITSARRHIPAALDLALKWRDPTCVVPGCDQTISLERDHWRTDFAKQGPTQLDNLCHLCPRHHHMKTRDGYRLLGGPGHWQWLPPPTPHHTNLAQTEQPKPDALTPPPNPNTSTRTTPPTKHADPTNDGGRAGRARRRRPGPRLFDLPETG